MVAPLGGSLIKIERRGRRGGGGEGEGEAGGEREGGGEGEGGGRSGGSELTATVVCGGVGFSKME